MDRRPTKTDLQEWWDTEERMDAAAAAEYLGIRVETFYKYRCTGRLNVPAYTYGRRQFFRKSDLLDAIAQGVRVLS